MAREQTSKSPDLASVQAAHGRIAAAANGAPLNAPPLLPIEVSTLPELSALASSDVRAALATNDAAVVALHVDRIKRCLPLINDLVENGP